jgi:hypothetical protein
VGASSSHTLVVTTPDNQLKTAGQNSDFRWTSTMALRAYQAFFKLPITGILDEVTITHMQKPRCGVPDAPFEAAFTVSGRRWNYTNLTYRVLNFTNDLAGEVVLRILRRAFDLWRQVLPTFSFTLVNGDADIIIRFVFNDHGDGDPFDGPGGVLAHAFFPPPNSGSLAGDIHFDDGEKWVNGFPDNPNEFDLFKVAAHEIGHALGLKHTDIKGALMYTPYEEQGSRLHADDIAGILSIYGFLPASDPSGYVLNGGQHVAYRGVDGHIHVLFAGDEWKFRNVSFEAGSPLAAGDPSGYVLNGGQHVAYRGVDGHIHVLFAGDEWKVLSDN